MGDGVKEGVLVSSALWSIHPEQRGKSILVYEKNKGAQATWPRVLFVGSARLKHVDLRRHFLYGRRWETNKGIKILSCSKLTP